MRFFLAAILLAVLLPGCLSQTQSPQGAGSNLPANGTASLQQSSLQNNSSAVVLARGNPAPIPPPGPVYNYSLTRTGDGRLIVYYFYSSYQCPTCDDSRPLIEKLKGEYGNAVEWREFDLQNASQSPVYWSFVNYRNLTACLQKVPAAFFNNTLLIGYATENSLEGAINGSLISAYGAQP